MIARRFLFAQLRVHFIQINFADWHFIGWILRVVFEQIKITFADFIDQVHREIVKVIFDKVCTFWPVPFAFVKAWDVF